MASVSNAPASQAGQTWHHAMKLRKHLLKQLEKVQSDGGIDLAQFEKIDSLLQSLRLSCVQTIFLDFEYAVAEKTESVLWTLHTSVNTEYRRALGKLKGNAHVVEKRKVDKMYQNFLRVAQQFYKGYVQRIAARYDIQELRRIAHGLDVEQDGAGDMISPVPEKLSRLVLLSCHSTLIRLGDLARYRVQAKYKKFGGFESALTFYSLANDLVPESGFGHHQMGIIELEEGNHLEVVYRFYRAWAAADPHPNAKSNLESKLRDLRASNTPSPRQVSATPRDTFSMWFVRLHALFYKGEPFSQHVELEGEVIHRLDMMAKNPEAGEVLLKTILINIASFHIASSKHAESKKETDLQFARFTLALNARFATAICNVLGAELERHAHGRRSDVGTFENDELPPVLTHLLPMLRVYMTWFASQRRAIFSSPEATGGLVSAMLQSLARGLTLLCAEATEHKGLASYPFLLWEDLETRGLQPLGFDQVPEACRCYCDENGVIKPRQEPQSAGAEVHRQGLARLLDILRAGYFLAEDSTAPLVHRIVDDALLFEYTAHQPGINMDSVEAKAYSTDLIESAAAKQAVQARPGLLELYEAPPNGLGPLPNDTTWPDFSNGDDATNDRTENTVMSMLTPFLKPPTPQLAGLNSAASETSYGLHSATAEDVFGSIAAQRSPGGTILPTTFEQLPWGWLHTPTPSKGNRDNHESFSEQSNLPNGLSVIESSNILQHDRLQSPLAGRAPSAASYGRPPVPLRSPFTPLEDSAHRNSLLQSFSGVGSAPRTSSFSHWSPDHPSMRSRQAETSPWTTGGANAPNPVPLSSNMSAFSHSSSLYQGTPMDNVSRNNASVNSAGRGLSSSNSWQSSRPDDRQRQVNNATSSYDAAIFDAAFRD